MFRSLHLRRRGHVYQAPLAPDTVDPAQQELPEAHHRFDNAEHRFRDLFVQRVELSTFRWLQPVCHGLDRGGIRRCGRRRREALGQRRVMRLAAHPCPCEGEGPP
jgi:hypothetical protein